MTWVRFLHAVPSYMYRSTGVLEYDPHARIKSEPWWCILRTDPEIVRYYQWWLKKRYKLGFEKTIWGSHISVNRGAEPLHKRFWKKYKGKKIQFTYDNEIYQPNPKFFCVNAYSTQLEEIREELGLSRLPPFGFHITIGRITPEYVKT